MTCPYCRKSIASNVLVCPRCTKDLRTEEAQTLIAKERQREQRVQMGCLGVSAVIALMVASCWYSAYNTDQKEQIAAQQEETRLEGNLGKRACNATNGVFRGVIIGVSQMPTQSGNAWVYRVTLDGVTRNAPVSNVTVIDANAKCPDGEPQ
jgi:predicted nucleic acid-binding Zn ribbon protein